MKLQKGLIRRAVNRVPGKAMLVCLVVSLTAVTAEAQMEANNWFFGKNAGLSFATTPPTSLANSAMATGEGCAVMSDQNGQLLFYTDGSSVWDRTHHQMPNGFGLKGNKSATQSAIIVPWPETECQRYYVFTVNAAEDPRPQSLYYAVVDMTQHGLLGDVVLKQQFLKNPVSEKLTAVADDTGTGFWVIAHGFDYSNSSNPVNNEFYAYHIGVAGLNLNLVLSPAGTAHFPISTNTNDARRPSAGQMKVSPDGKLIACAVRERFVEVLNFHTNSGVVDNQPTQPRFFDATKPPFQTNSVYGVEFSSFSNFLYVSTSAKNPNEIIQFDLNTTNPSAPVLLSSITVSGSAPFHEYGALQLGPDQNIYVARYNKKFISVINYADTAAPIFVPSGPPSPAWGSGVNSLLGLPTIICGRFSCSGINPHCDFAATPGCPGQATTFTDLSTGAASWNWNFGDGSVSPAQNPTHVYQSPGPAAYLVTLTVTVDGQTCTAQHIVNMLAAPTAPVINGSPTTCNPGAYTVAVQSGTAINWIVTNGTITAGQGTQTITVAWNGTGNGLVAVTLTQTKTSCKTTAQLLVPECPRPPCCRDVNIAVSTPKPNYDFCQPTPGYVLTPTLTVTGLGNITQMSADILSASVSYPLICGMSGPLVASFASPASENGLSATLNSGELVWTATNSSGVPFGAGVTFNLIKIVLPPPHPTCSYMLSLCIKYTFTDDKCVTCSIIKCVTFDLQPKRPSNPPSC